MLYMVIVGNPADGFDYWGPWGEHDDAAEWAEDSVDGDWWIGKVYPV